MFVQLKYNERGQLQWSQPFTLCLPVDYCNQLETCREYHPNVTSILILILIFKCFHLNYISKYISILLRTIILFKVERWSKLLIKLTLGWSCSNEIFGTFSFFPFYVCFYLSCLSPHLLALWHNSSMLHQWNEVLFLGNMLLAQG